MAATEFGRIGAARDRAADASRILVVRLGAIGDALRVLPAVRRLRLAFPDASIGWAVEDWVHPVLAGNPNVDRFHVLCRGALRAGPLAAVAEMRRFVAELRAARYDTVLDFHGRLKSGLVSWLSGAGTRIGYGRGFDTEGNHLFTNVHVQLDDPGENRVLRFLRLLGPLAVEPIFDPRDTGLFVAAERREKALVWFAAAGEPPVAAFPGTSRFQAAYHRWPGESWVRLLRLLATEGVRSVVFWGPDEAEEAGRIAAEAGEGCRLAPTTGLPEMMAMIGCFRAFIGSNTAAMHMAWLQGVPTAVFPGPADPRIDSPLDVVPSRRLWAGQHYRPGEKKRYQAEVVHGVTVEEAARAVRELLGAKAGLEPET